MSEYSGMRESMRLLAAEAERAEASPAVRAALLKEVRRHRARRLSPWWMAAAAALVIGAGIGIWTNSNREVAEAPVLKQPVQTATVEPVEPVNVQPLVTESSPAIPPRVATAPRRAVATQTAATARLAATPWMIHQALPPAERGQVLRLPVSADLARQFGVPQQSGEWQAEIFVGDDGLARAFRLVRMPAYK